MAGYRFPLEQDEKYKARVLFVAKNATGIKTCSLYFPEAVNFSDGLVYDNANLGIAGETTRRLIEKAGNLMSEILAAVNEKSETDKAQMIQLVDDAKSSILSAVSTVPSIHRQGDNRLLNLVPDVDGDIDTNTLLKAVQGARLP